jgi:hypothetical protein
MFDVWVRVPPGPIHSGSWQSWLLQRIVNPCYGIVGSNPIDPILFGRSIIGNAFDLGSKDCRFKSCRPDLFIRPNSIMVLRESAKLQVKVRFLSRPIHGRWQSG